MARRREELDLIGAVALTGFAALFAVNQVVIKLVNGGLDPVFFAGLRSAIAAVAIWGALRLGGRPAGLRRRDLGPGLLVGALFALQFTCLFSSLDHTSVARCSIIFYSMPVWAVLGAHFLLPGERMAPLRGLGLALSVLGVAWAMLNREGPAGAEAGLLGDLLALGGALCWAATTLCVRATSLREVPPASQLLWQVTVSAPVLLVLAPLLGGPMLRDFVPLHLAGLLFQALVVVSGGFVAWFWLLSIYPASAVTSFSFLTPVIGVFMGWLLLDEHVGASALGALALVAVGIVLVNRPARRRAEAATPS